eukprot:5181383-Pleurochrysis_carterae.AAC.1
MDNIAVQSVHIRIDKLGRSVGLGEGTETTKKTKDAVANERPGALPVGPCGDNNMSVHLRLHKQRTLPNSFAIRTPGMAAAAR